MGMAELHHRPDDRDAFIVPLHLPHIPYAHFPGCLGDARLITNDKDLNILQPDPGLESISLDDSNVRISKRLGRRKDSQEGHFLEESLFRCQVPQILGYLFLDPWISAFEALFEGQPRLPLENLTQTGIV